MNNSFNRTPDDFNWDNFQLNSLKPYLKNDLFEGIVGKQEFILLSEADVIDRHNTVLIAIHDPDADNHNPEHLTGFKDVLEIKFWDIEEQIGNYKPLSDEQGKLLFDFITKHKNSKFLVHCHAGMSRSAGVACAIECIVYENGNKYYYSTSHSDVKSFSRYHPNYTVFDKIINH